MRLRRLRFALLGLAAGAVILLGVLAGLTHLVMPWLVSHPQSVARWLGERLDREVTIGHLDGAWYGGGPVLMLDDVRIAAGDKAQAPLAIAHAQLKFDLLAPLRRNHAFSEFRIDGLDLQLAQEEGRWVLHGLDLGTQGQSGQPFSMGALGALELTRLRLRIDDAARDLHLDLAVPVLRIVNRGAITRVLARVAQQQQPDALVDAVADLDPVRRSGEIYVGGRNVDLARVLAARAPAGVRVASAHGLAQAWLFLREGSLDEARVKLDLRDTTFAGEVPLDVGALAAIEPRASFPRLALTARWQRVADGWDLSIAQFLAGEITQTPARALVQRRGSSQAAQWNMAAKAVTLEPLGSLAMLSSRLPESLRRWLYLAHPRGRIDDLALRWASRDDYDVRATLRAAEISSADFAPAIDALDVDIIGDAQSMLLQLPTQATRLAMPRVFRQPFAFSALGGDIVVRRADAEAWRIETDRLTFDGDAFGGELRGAVELKPGRRPFLDLYAVTHHAQVPAAKLFWPVNIMPPAAVQWLDRGLVSGQVVEGRVAVRGDLADWPFRNHAGYFVARGEIDDAVLDYNAQWPRAENIHAIANFVNDGMQVDASAGASMGNAVQSASATIADFHAVVLDLAVKGNGSAANLLAFLRATPIGKRYAEPLKDLLVDGKAGFEFKLSLPVAHVEDFTLEGSGQLQARKLEQLRYDQHFSDVSGTLRFTHDGLLADALDASYRQRPAKLTVAIGSFVAEASHVFEARVSGVYPAAVVFADVPVLAPVVAHWQGESTWQAEVAVAAPVDGRARTQLTLDSDLLGTAIDLPEPLAKPATASWPLHIDLDLPYAGQRARLRLGDVLAATAQLPDANKAFGLRLQFGAGDAGEPPASDIVIGGRVRQLDTGGWLDVVGADSGTAEGLVRSIDVQADDLLLGGRHFAQTRLAIDNAPQATHIRVDGAAIAGQLDIPRPLDARGISARFTRVHWPEAPAGTPDSGALSSVAPGALPPLHLTVDDFQLGTANFGAAKFESHPLPDGMAVETLETHSPNIDMTARGEWRGSATANQSRMAIVLRAKNLGRMMDALGFPGLIDGGKTVATIDASWPGPPSAFALSNLDGKLDIDIAEGRIPDAHPGAGRIFGLLSITEIPRRLSLDFSDFFQAGLGFNSIKGSFRLADGNAWTDGLRIDSPAADIIVTGRTGLRAKDYDQHIDVEPRAGATLPIVGAIAGGPVGAAAGLVVQGILNKPISKAVARQYTVTGSWDKPQFTQIERARGTAASPGGKPTTPRRPER